MKLLFFASDYTIGLSSVLTDQLIAYSRIITLQLIGIAGERSQESDLEDRIRVQHIRLHKISGLDDHKNFFKLVKALNTFINIEKPDIIHVQNNWQLVLIGLVNWTKSSSKFKIIYTIHGFRNNHFLKSFIARILIGGILFLFADRIIYMSDYVKKKFSILSYKMNKIYYGIDQRFYEKSHNRIDIEELRLIFPAQFRHGKNQGLLIKSFADYCKECNDYSSRLYLPGEGEFKQKNQLLATSLHISDQVIFPGLLSLKSTRDLIETCNLIVISSNSETFGKAIVEGYVLGRCILTKNVGVASDVIEEGINGYFFRNELELKSLLVQLSRNKSTIEEIGNNNFANREIFSWSHSIKDYSELISNLVH